MCNASLRKRFHVLVTKKFCLGFLEEDFWAVDIGLSDSFVRGFDLASGLRNAVTRLVGVEGAAWHVSM